MILFPVVIPSLLVSPPPVAAEGEALFGTRPDAVMVEVTAQFSEEFDARLWHLPLRSAAVRDGRTVVLELKGRGGPRLYLPVDPSESAPEVVELVKNSFGELLQLEYHPTVEAPAGRVHASWILSPEPKIRGSGSVPLTTRLFSEMLRLVGEEVPETGIFARAARARRRLLALHHHATRENGRRVDALAESFLEAVRGSGLPLNFFHTPDGEAVTEAVVKALREQGHRRSARGYWNEALNAYRGKKIVNPTLSRFEKAWELCDPDRELLVDPPGGGAKVAVSRESLREFRKLAAQRFLDRAARTARARLPRRTALEIERFREELKAANSSVGHFSIEDFSVGEGRASERALKHLIREARGETGLFGWLWVLWHRIRGLPPEDLRRR